MGYTVVTLDVSSSLGDGLMQAVVSTSTAAARQLVGKIILR